MAGGWSLSSMKSFLPGSGSSTSTSKQKAFPKSEEFVSRADDESDEEESDSDAELEPAPDFMAKLNKATRKTTPQVNGQAVQSPLNSTPRSPKQNHDTASSPKTLPPTTQQSPNMERDLAEREADSTTSSDSSSEEEENPNPPNPQNQDRKTASNAVEEDDTSSSSGDSEDEEEEANPAKNMSRLVDDAASEGSSSEDTSDEESEGQGEEDSDGDAPTKSMASKITSSPKPINTTQSNSAKTLAKPAAPSESSSASEAEASEQESEDSDVDMADDSLALVPRNDDSDDDMEELEVPDELPDRFQLRKADPSLDASDLVKFMKQAKREGKQVFYFTVPDSAPVTMVEHTQFPLDQVQQGKSIFSNQGENYGMRPEDSQTSKTIKIIIPSKGGINLSTRDRPVDQVFHVKRVITTFGGQEVAGTDVQRKITAPTVPRPQPKGLKARFKPIGVEHVREKTSAESRAESTPPLKPLKTVSGTPKSSKKKRKHGLDATDKDRQVTRPSSQIASEVMKSPEKSKKRKHDFDSEDEELTSQQSKASELTGKTSKKAKTDGVSSQSAPFAAPSGTKKTPAEPPRPSNGTSVTKVTPIAPPTPSTRVSTSQPAFKTRDATSVSSSQPVQRSAIPLPSYISGVRSSSSASPAPPAVVGRMSPPVTHQESSQEQPSKLSKKERKKQERAREKAAATPVSSSQVTEPTPTKKTSNTPVVPPSRSDP